MNPPVIFFFPQSKDKHDRSIGVSKFPICVNSCLSLYHSPVADRPHTQSKTEGETAHELNAG